MNEEIQKQLRTLISTFNDKRVVSAQDVKAVLTAIITILAENKKSVDQIALETKGTADNLLTQAAQTLNQSTQDHIKSVLGALQKDYEQYSISLQKSSVLTKSEIEKVTKAQNDRAFKRLQDLISNLKLPQDGKNGQDANPADVVSLVLSQIQIPDLDTPSEIRDKLETLQGDERLDVSAIKGLADYFKVAKKAGKAMLIGGIRFFENLADVAILPANKRADLLAQYNTTNNRWQDGIALTVSLTQPTNPKVNDLWVDLN